MCHGGLQKEERFGTRTEPVCRRVQTSLWHDGKKRKTFLSKRFEQTKGHWLFLVRKANEGEILPCKDTVGRRGGIQRCVFSSYLMWVICQFSDLISDLSVQRIILF